MSKQKIGTAWETGGNWATWRLANEAQIDGFSGAIGEVFHANEFEGGTHNELLANWISKIGDKTLRVTQFAGNWKASSSATEFDIGVHGYTLAKILPKPEERVPALPAAPNSASHQGVFLGDVITNAVSALPAAPIKRIMPASTDGMEFNYALFAIKEKIGLAGVFEEVSTFAFLFDDDTMLSIQQLADLGWSGKLTKNRNGPLSSGPEIDRFRRIDLQSPANGVQYGLSANGSGYGIALAISNAGSSYGLAVLAASLDGGTGDYLPTGSSVVDVPTTGGDGEDLTVDIDIDSGGIVTAATIKDSGNGGYKSGNIITIDNSGGAGGTSASFELVVTGNQRIGSPNFQADRRNPFVDSIIAAGSGYTPNTTFNNVTVTTTTNSLGFTNDTDITDTRVSFTTDGAGVIIPSTLLFDRDGGSVAGDVGGSGFKTGDIIPVGIVEFSVSIDPGIFGCPVCSIPEAFRYVALKLKRAGASADLNNREGVRIKIVTFALILNSDECYHSPGYDYVYKHSGSST